MGNYTIKVDSSNPEFRPGDQLTNGLSADGFLLITIKDGEPQASVCMGLTIMELATAIASDKNEFGSVIRQAFAIAEGMQKAREIAESYRKNNVAKEIVEMLRAK